MRYIIFVFLLFSSLFSEEENSISELTVNQDVKEILNESAFGKANTYSLLIAKHQFNTEDEICIFAMVREWVL